ncbi:MAG: ABC transporter substrate-binding protein [Planctomycetota bacterium]|nr:ABC transporter substrate-binding protein [Planctomycetota bacterium]MDA1252203.1 ABC transporter substrate-binding protein [Planctomycetota bacterium]
MRLRSLLTVIGAALLAVSFSGCGSEEPSPGPKTALQKVQLKLNWFPEAEHGGFYAALVHGYYEEAGLAVEILPGGPNEPVRQEVATGRVQFGISNADQILTARAEKANIVGLFAALQTSPRCVMVHEKSGITSFDELKNLTLAINENSSFGSFLRRHASLEGCKIVPYPGNVSQFLLNEDFAQQGYVFSEPFTAKKEGGDPRNLMAADIGFNPYTSVLISSRKLIDEDPELVRKFVTATRKGWAKYLEDPAKTNAHIHEKNPEMGLDILEFGAKELKGLCTSETVTADNLGEMTTERWSLMTAQLIECEVVGIGQLPLDGKGAFTVEFLSPAKASGKAASESNTSEPEADVDAEDKVGANTSAE